MTLRSRKSGYGLLLRCVDQRTRSGIYLIFLFGDARTSNQKWSQTRKVSTVWSGILSQFAIDRAWSNLSGRIACCSRKSRRWERCDKDSAGKEITPFWPEIFQILEQKTFPLNFLAAEELTFLRGGGYNSKNWLAIIHLWVYTSMPHPYFGAKDVCYIEEKVGQIMIAS